MKNKLQATILTGFLGAGKTTLLNRILDEKQGEKIAVIVNEFGEVGIDGQLIVETTEDVVELNNGCICCTVRDDLIGAVRALLASGKQFDRIVVETSGLADPAPVIQSFLVDEVLLEKVSLDAVVTVVDARHIDQQLAQHETVEQIGFADLILLNKLDLVPPGVADEVERKLRRLNPLARIIRTENCAVGLDQLINIGAFDLKNILAIEPGLLDGHAHDHEHDQSVGCVALRETAPLEASAFNRWMTQLVQDTGPDLFRVKGVIQFAGDARRFVFHGVHMTLDGRPGKAWKQDLRVSEIVFIGRSLDEASLRGGFENCIANRAALAS